MFKKMITPALVTLAIGLTGCSTMNNKVTHVDTPSQENRLELLLGEWQIEDVNGAGIIDSSHITITFNEEGRAYGSASCNRYSSQYELNGDSLTFSHSLATKMACPEALMNQEQKFLAVFNEINQFSIDKTGALILKSQDGKTLRGYSLEQ